MDVTLLGIVTDVREVHESKADSPYKSNDVVIIDNINNNNNNESNDNCYNYNHIMPGRSDHERLYLYYQHLYRMSYDMVIKYINCNNYFHH